MPVSPTLMSGARERLYASCWILADIGLPLRARVADCAAAATRGVIPKSAFCAAERACPEEDPRGADIRFPRVCCDVRPLRWSIK